MSDTTPRRRPRTRVDGIPSPELVEFAAATGTPLFVSLPVVAQLLGVSQSTVKKLRQQGRFPQPVDLTGGGAGRAVGWRLSEVQQWMEARPVAGPGGADMNAARKGVWTR